MISDFEQIHFQSDPARNYASFSGFLTHQAPDYYQFRLQSLSAATIDAGADDDEAQTISLAKWTTFQPADIHKMHAYKDALGARRDQERQKVRSVWVLYPGDVTAFFSETGGRVTAVPDHGGDLLGVGALPMQPDRDPTELRRALRTMLGES